VNQAHLLHALREYEAFSNEHRPPAHSAVRHLSTHSPNRSPNAANATTSTSEDAIDSAASSTNTNTPPELHG
jgi:hypothetical protein